MKITILICSVLACLCSQVGHTQTVTLTPTPTQTINYSLKTNQIITVNSFIASGTSGYALVSFDNGTSISLNAYQYGLNTSGTAPKALAETAVFTGATNIFAYSPAGSSVALTFTITTPTPQSMIPANAVVIPSDATGPVQIVLESSSDLVNWIPSLPGTYGNTYSNRFFRVRAIAQ